MNKQMPVTRGTEAIRERNFIASVRVGVAWRCSHKAISLSTTVSGSPVTTSSAIFPKIQLAPMRIMAPIVKSSPRKPAGDRRAWRKAIRGANRVRRAVTRGWAANPAHRCRTSASWRTSHRQGQASAVIVNRMPSRIMGPREVPCPSEYPRNNGKMPLPG